MTNIIPLPEREKQPTPLPRQRVFHLGFVYRGPMFCQEIQISSLHFCRAFPGLKHLDSSLRLHKVFSLNKDKGVPIIIGTKYFFI